MRALKDSYLYGIVDLGYVKPEDVPAMTLALVEGGVDLLQLRAKKFTAAEVERLARLMHPITRDGGIPLIINDHPEVAAVVGSEGVHVGQDDKSVEATRRIVGPGCFVGKSTHSVAQARAAMAEGADYIGFGPLYATGTKPDYVPIGLQDIAEVHAFATCPVFCIGGVNPERLPEIVGAGAKRVVVVSAWLQAEDVRGAVGAVNGLLRRCAG
ncbi:thiamine phosphate synthase [Verrucomicrobium sp. BvORR106]|uniref:thiamine phosphate synthase n=1 Tax=Verrucomicrobium sp. BvORR106 TaxID=1403819 RepID=UPI000570995E|nr:thiamine phosphate synthase [Verrucomicrobium sp. BvORR106]